MNMRKIAGLGLSLLLIFGITGTAGFRAPLFARADETETTEETPAAPAYTALNGENAELFLPTSYEQYLPLVNPAYAAFGDDYVAVADENKLYVYDRTEEQYTVYTHTSGQYPVNISKIQFTKDGELYFRDMATNLYRYDFAENTASILHNMGCTTFLIEGDYLYLAVNSPEAQRVSFSYVPLDDLRMESVKYLVQDLFANNPRMTYADGILYCVVNNNTIYAYDAETHSYVSNGTKLDSATEQVNGLQFVCAYGGSLYYSVNGSVAYPNGLYRSDFQGNAERVLAGDGFTALSTKDDKLYCVRGSSVLGLTVSDMGVGYSGYEISASSDSVNRLSNASDAVRAGDLLVTADSANRRVSVYNFKSGEFSVISCADEDFSPSLVATDGETIACASGVKIYACKYGDERFGEPLQTAAQATIRGIACVYGSVYYVTANKQYGKAGSGESVVHEDYGTPKRMTRDLYGNLFVSYESDLNCRVYTFTESNFLQRDAGVRLGFFLPSSHTSLRSDFEGNLYCLSGNAVYKNGEKFAEIDGTDYVYSGKTAPESFALGFEDGEVYFLFGNYAVKSKDGALDIPTLGKIETGDAKETVFSDHGEIALLADIPAGEIGIGIDLGALKESDSPYFPYVGYSRLTEGKRGVLLAETDKHFVVLLAEKQSYDAVLYRKNGVTVVPDSEYWTAAESEKYLSSDVSAYFAPALASELAGERLARGASVRVLGFVQAPEREYARIRYGSEERAVFTAYIPKSYLTEVSPHPVRGDEYLAAFLKPDGEGIVFRTSSGETLLVTERTAATFAEQEDGSYLARIEKDGEVYTAYVSKDRVDFGNSDAVRISLIIILTVLALVIIGAYVYLLPRKKERGNGVSEERGKKAKK